MNSCIHVLQKHKKQQQKHGKYIKKSAFKG